MSKRPGFATPGRPRKLPLGASNTQIPFVDDMDDDLELDENDLDESKLHLLTLHAVSFNKFCFQIVQLFEMCRFIVNNSVNLLFSNSANLLLNNNVNLLLNNNVNLLLKKHIIIRILVKKD
jgi:hypothetical protein